MELTLSRMPDDQSVAAIMYGPIVLAGALGTEAMTKEMQSGLGWADVDRMVSMGAAVEAPVLVPLAEELSSWIKPVGGKPLTFRTEGAGKPNDITLLPFYKMFGQRYAIYWNIYSPANGKTCGTHVPRCWMESSIACSSASPHLSGRIISRPTASSQANDKTKNGSDRSSGSAMT